MQDPPAKEPVATAVPAASPPMDGSGARSEPEASLARVELRLNRLAVQRAVYSALAAPLLAVAIAAAAAAALGPGPFRLVLAGLAAASLTVVARQVARLRAAWADRLAAARWVEARVSLEQRLVTLVAAEASARGSALWPALVADNRAQLGRWANAPHDIPRVPASLALPLVALALALLALLPWRPGEPTAPLGAPSGAGDVPAEDSPGEPGAGALAGAGAGLLQAPMAGSRGAGAVTGDAGITAAVAGVQRELGERFARSVVAKLLAQPERPRREGDVQPDAALLARADPGRGTLAQSAPEAGGVTPDAELARREADDGTGQTVRRQDAPPGPGSGPSGEPGGGAPAGSPSESRPAGAGASGRARASRSNLDAPAPKAAADAANAPGTGGGGGGAGAGKASAPLLAAAPLTAADGRAVARFALTLGAGTTAAGGAPGSQEKSPVETRSRVADVARGPQAAERTVRREEVPAEYEDAVKRIFAREP